MQFQRFPLKTPLRKGKQFVALNQVSKLNLQTFATQSYA